MILVLALTSVSALAAPAMTVSTALTLGNTKQEASNPLADDASDRDIYVTGTVTITNTGTETLSSFKLNSVLGKTGFTDTDLKTNVSFAATTLAVNGTMTATYKMRIPEKLDAISATTFKEISFDVADVVLAATGSSQVTATTAVKMQRENRLEVENVRLCVNGRCKNVDDGDDIDNLHPGDKIELEITVENLFSDSDKEDLDIEDVELEWEIDDDDFNEDEDENMGDINADSKETETFSFEIEDDVKDGNYDLDIKVTGTDENGADHAHKIQIDLKVERKAHEIDIRRATANPSKLACGQFTGRVDVAFTNIGRRNEDEVIIGISHEELGISESIGPFDLDEDDSDTQSMSYSVPETAKPGNYLIVVKSFFDISAQSDETTVEVEVPDCDGKLAAAEAATSSSETQTEAKVKALEAQLEAANNAQVLQKRTRASSTSTSSEDSFKESAWYTALLVLITLMILGALVTIVMKFFKREEE